MIYLMKQYEIPLKTDTEKIVSGHHIVWYQGPLLCKTVLPSYIPFCYEKTQQPDEWPEIKNLERIGSNLNLKLLFTFTV